MTHERFGQGHHSHDVDGPIDETFTGSVIHDSQNRVWALRCLIHRIVERGTAAST